MDELIKCMLEICAKSIEIVALGETGTLQNRSLKEKVARTMSEDGDFLQKEHHLKEPPYYSENRWFNSNVVQGALKDYQNTRWDLNTGYF